MDNFLISLESEYAGRQLNLKKALDVWKEHRISANDIQSIVKEDIGKNITFAEAKFLQRSARFLFNDSRVATDYFASSFDKIQKTKSLIERMKTARTIKLTPDVRGLVEKVGNNSFRSKYGEIQWSIVMVDGKPHLARRDTEPKEAIEKKGAVEGQRTKKAFGDYSIDSTILDSANEPGKTEPVDLGEESPTTDVLLELGEGTELEKLVEKIKTKYNMDEADIVELVEFVKSLGV